METTIAELLKASSSVLTGLALMVVMKGFKAMPRFPNYLIPFTAMVLGAIAYPSIEAWNPRNVMIGIVIGGFSTGMHQGWQQIVWRKEDVKEGDTTWMDKTGNEPPRDKPPLIKLP